ncbi:transcription initiation factor TFIID subunit 12 [Dendroctonus ponderosae]|uniref:transcription initiation factor TFIID subunit 12 n=1 Tax=Dendroctonus ponderosae TaxID=77166 RepID=UPI002034DE67|nr:transcription initiation factor TFIID subunit 12 [Dendroctonus ponderosae]KAH1028520.1 hypothetical protein HUJ05_001872 [Dendroctonus ponderosae]
MQNNFQQQNIVNQPVGHLTQNNGIIGNSMPHENQVSGHNNMTDSQAMQGAHTQHMQQTHGQNSAMMNKPATQHVNSGEGPQIVSRQKLQDLVREIDHTITLEDDVEDILLSYVDDFVDRCLNGATLIAKNRNGNSIEVKDVQQFLNRNYNMWTPGFGTDELRPYKRSLTTEAHKQRNALIRKTVKKY